MVPVQIGKTCFVIPPLIRLERDWPIEPTNAQYRPVPQPAMETPPLVLIEGFLSYTSEFWWGDFATHLNAHRVKVGSQKRREIIFARVGPANSAHDRACELFYSLRGGTVDYGEQHARENGHRRFGRSYKVGLYPSWSREHPLHLLGHSMGGVTIVKMMTLVSDGFFPDAHPDMIASINTVGSPHRGTQLAYYVAGTKGNSSRFGHGAPSNLVSRYIHLLSYFSPILPSAVVPDFHSESRDLTLFQISPLELLRQLYHSDWSESKDATPWDTTFTASEERDEDYQRFRAKQTLGGREGRTWYRAYAMSYTDRSDTAEPYHAPRNSRFLTSPFFWWTAMKTGQFDFSSLPTLPKFLSAPSQHSPPPRPRSSTASSLRRGRRRQSLIEITHTHTTSSGFSSDTDSTVFSSGSSSPSISDVDESEPLDDERDVEEFLDKLRLEEKQPSEAAPFSSGTAHVHSFKKSLRESHYENDGVVPTFSQWHPGDCDELHCIHHAPLTGTARLPMPTVHSHPHSHAHSHPHSYHRPRKPVSRPGIWNVITINDSHHVSLMPMWVGSMKQRTFWYGLGEWLEEVDSARQYLDLGLALPVDMDPDQSSISLMEQLGQAKASSLPMSPSNSYGTTSTVFGNESLGGISTTIISEAMAL
ncbi:hypothetical protein DL93DRAFT_2151564 [Clavulina sp. PMI_390]|nr:hypothetical protein DL93DRAFT_2151564 [Clavulina sp. PMI_390]